MADDGILRMAFVFRIGEHSSHFCIRAEVIPFMIPAVCISEGIGGQVYGAYAVVGAWYVADKQVSSINIYDIYIRFMRQTHAYFPLVMCTIPEILHVFVGRFFRKSIQ